MPSQIVSSQDRCSNFEHPCSSHRRARDLAQARFSLYHTCKRCSMGSSRKNFICVTGT